MSSSHMTFIIKTNTQWCVCVRESVSVQVISSDRKHRLCCRKCLLPFPHTDFKTVLLYSVFGVAHTLTHTHHAEVMSAFKGSIIAFGGRSFSPNRSNRSGDRLPHSQQVKKMMKMMVFISLSHVSCSYKHVNIFFTHCTHTHTLQQSDE